MIVWLFWLLQRVQCLPAVPKTPKQFKIKTGDYNCQTFPPFHPENETEYQENYMENPLNSLQIPPIINSLIFIPNKLQFSKIFCSMMRVEFPNQNTLWIFIFIIIRSDTNRKIFPTRKLEKSFIKNFSQKY